MRVVVIHGFNLYDDGASTVDRLVPYIEDEGWEVDKDEADYGFLSLWKVILFNGKARQKVLYRITKAIEEADLVIGHSNGANFGLQALAALPDEEKEKKLAVWISGAASTKVKIPHSVKKMLVLHTPYDIWVRLATYIPFNKWGRMGCKGYKGDDKRVINIKSRDMKQHSAWFRECCLDRTWTYVTNFVSGNNQ